MFTAGNLIIGSLAALIVGLSKTALPGAGLVATPIIAVFDNPTMSAASDPIIRLPAVNTGVA